LKLPVHIQGNRYVSHMLKNVEKLAIGKVCKQLGPVWGSLHLKDEISLI